MNGLLGRLKLWQKLTILGALGVMMALPPLVMYWRASSAGIDAAQMELAGIVPTKALLQLIQYTQQHRGVSAGFLGGNNDFATQRQQKQALVDEEIAAAQGILTRDIQNPKIVADWNQAVLSWAGVARDVQNQSISGAESFKRHTALITEYLEVLDSTVDYFGLSRDPDAEGYPLISAGLFHMPSLPESLGQARARGALYLAKKEISAEDRSNMEALISLAQLHYRNMKRALDKVVELNPALKSKLGAAIQASAAEADNAFHLAAEQVIRPEQLTFDSGEFFSRYTKIIDTQFALNDRVMEALTHVLHTRERDLKMSQFGVFGIILLSVFMAIGVSFVVTRSITMPLADAVALARKVANGDLTSRIEVTSKNETGQLLAALRSMNEGLVKIVSEVRDGTELISTASQQIASGNADLSQRTEEQASSLEETASSMEELTSTVRLNAENARQANQLATGASEVAVQGGEMVGQVVKTMASINESSRKIADIIGVIDGIAFQTNILALNAAVEAARAGEQGRGFAVVATEVRNLAQRSAAAAKDIKTLIGDSVEKVDAGAKLVDQTGETMSKIVITVKRMTDLMAEIAAASHEQSAGIEQVNQAITQMDQVTQQNAALVEEAAAAAESMEDQAHSLAQTVSVFKLSPGEPGMPTPIRIEKPIARIAPLKIGNTAAAKVLVITERLPAKASA